MSVVLEQQRAGQLGRQQAVHLLAGVALALTVGVLVHELGHAAAAWLLGGRGVRLDLWAWPPRTLYAGAFSPAGWAWIDMAGGLATFVGGVLLAAASRRWGARGSWVRDVGGSAGGAMAIIDNTQWVVLPVRYAISPSYRLNMRWQVHHGLKLVPDSIKFLVRTHLPPLVVAMVAAELMVWYTGVFLVE
ncbi:MAG: M50 family metallopeptidase [Limnochordaceae bacterium]|nr:M50 family metallopeptidase [Limnochordaceae bacterium]